jgi:hypothetical protein
MPAIPLQACCSFGSEIDWQHVWSVAHVPVAEPPSPPLLEPLLDPLPLPLPPLLLLVTPHWLPQLCCSHCSAEFWQDWQVESIFDWHPW